MQDKLQELQNIQTPDEWSEGAEPEGEKVEFLGSDRSRLRECYIYHEGEKEEVLPSEASGLLKIISELIDETKSDWDEVLSVTDFDDPDELRGISEEKYYIWLQFDQPPVDILEYGEEKEVVIDKSDKFIVEVDREEGEIYLNHNLGVNKKDMAFYTYGTVGKLYEIENFLKKYEKWKSDKESKTDKDHEILAENESEKVESKGEKVEFLGSDRSRLQECYIYHEGEKEEVLPSEVGGLLKIISEFVDETKSYWGVLLGEELLNNPDELRDRSAEKISEGKYYIWLQFDQPPVDIEFGDGEKAGIDESDKFIVEIDQEGGGITLNYNIGIFEGNIDFYQLGTMGMQYEVDCFMKKFKKWESHKGDETFKDQDIVLDTEGEDAELKAEKVEFLGSDRAWLQECYIYHEGGKEEILLSEASGLLEIISEFINETKSDWHKDLETLELKNSDELKDMSEEKYYIWLQFYETPVGYLEYGDGEFTFTGKGDKLIMEIDRKKGEFFMNYNQNDNEDSIEFRSCGMEGKQDKIESFLERYEGWKAGKSE